MVTREFNPSTIAIIDDDDGVRKSLCMLMETREWKHAEFERATDFLDNAVPSDFNCMLVDVRIPDMSGLELFEELSRRAKKQHLYLPPILFLTGHGDIPMAVKTLRQGATDFLEKPVNHRTLLDAIKRALKIDAEQREVFHSQAQLLKEIAALTSREREVLSEILEGYLSKQIGEHLNISTKTVEAHRLKICQKFNIRTGMELAAKFREVAPEWWRGE